MPAHERIALEERDPGWAPVMEGILRKRWSPALLAEAGLTGVQMLELSCFRTMCRLIYEYPRDWRDKPAIPIPDTLRHTTRFKLRPADVLSYLYGPYASGATTVDDPADLAQPGHEVHHALLIFENERDPANYEAWVNAIRDAQHARRAARLAKDAGM